MNMKKIFFLSVIMACVACNEFAHEYVGNADEVASGGHLRVTVEQASDLTKAQTDYTAVLDVEKAVNNVTVLVFDKATGVLNASKELGSLTEECEFTITTGEKTVYAVVNYSDLGSVTTISQLEQKLDDLSETDVNTDGFVMVGSRDCTVRTGTPAEPVITVKRLVARVVLQKITNRIPAQYGYMVVNCVYLGNANTVQSFSGEVSSMLNPGGYADAAKTKPIGKSSVLGSCPGYLFKTVSANIATGATNSTRHHMYCQPNSDDENVTCLYILATIGGVQYYYRVPLHLGLAANTTCSVEVEIANLGALLPPDGDMQKGEIKATINISGWDTGEKYEVQF